MVLTDNPQQEINIPLNGLSKPFNPLLIVIFQVFQVLFIYGLKIILNLHNIAQSIKFIIKEGRDYLCKVLVFLFVCENLWVSLEEPFFDLVGFDQLKMLRFLVFRCDLL